ncbi:MAG: CopG family transcriptional regulator [Candidatus Brocadiia bacterium]
MPDARPEVVTFKADPSLLEAMRGIPNRSEFIRNAILAALDGVCPLCKGTGIMSPNQRRHWQAFIADHAVEECERCHELRLVCANATDGSP